MIGQTISHYRISALLGRGGMGVVYEAVDLRLDRTVALKVLQEGPTADSRSRNRFVREARAAARLDHPNVGVVYEVGETADGTLFIAMARYDGRTLRDLLDDGPLPVSEAVGLARQVAAGLGAAHLAGVVHRDVKPENVVVTNDGTAKVIDFGIAKLDDRGATATADGAAGSAPYMSPEQARGGRADARADVWAVGVVLYESLVGRRPFAGRYPAAVAYQAAHESPPPIRSTRPEVPEAVSDVVVRCLQKDPSERYADGAELEAALRFVGESPRPGAPESPGPLRGSRRFKAWAAATVVSLMAFAAASAWSASDAEELYRAGRADLQEHWDPARVDAAARNFEQALALDSTLAPAWAALGEARVRWAKVDPGKPESPRGWPADSSTYNSAKEYGLRALELAPGLADGYVTLGLAGLYMEDHRAAEYKFRQALQSDSTHAAAWRGIGELHYSTGNISASVSAYRRAIDADPTHWAGYAGLAGALMPVDFTPGSAEQAEGIRLLERAAELSPSNRDVRLGLSLFLASAGRFEDAEAALRPLFADSPDDGDLHFALGLTYLKAGELDRAADQFGQVGPYGHMVSPWTQLAEAYRARGEVERSEDAYDRALLSVPEERAKPSVRINGRVAITVSEALNAAVVLSRSGASKQARRLLARAPIQDGLDASAAATAHALLGDSTMAARLMCSAVSDEWAFSMDPSYLLSDPDLRGVIGPGELDGCRRGGGDQ